MANARQRNNLRYQAIKLAVLKLKYIIILSTQERKYETKPNLPFAVPGNVKLKLPMIIHIPLQELY
jgi:hypothetical protein